MCGNHHNETVVSSRSYYRVKITVLRSWNTKKCGCHESIMTTNEPSWLILWKESCTVWGSYIWNPLIPLKILKLFRKKSHSVKISERSSFKHKNTMSPHLLSWQSHLTSDKQSSNNPDKNDKIGWKKRYSREEKQLDEATKISTRLDLPSSLHVSDTNLCLRCGLCRLMKGKGVYLADNNTSWQVQTWPSGGHLWASVRCETVCGLSWEQRWERDIGEEGRRGRWRRYDQIARGVCGCVNTCVCMRVSGCVKGWGGTESTTKKCNSNLLNSLTDIQKSYLHKESL